MYSVIRYVDGDWELVHLDGVVPATFDTYAEADECAFMLMLEGEHEVFVLCPPECASHHKDDCLFICRDVSCPDHGPFMDNYENN